MVHLKVNTPDFPSLGPSPQEWVQMKPQYGQLVVM